MLKRLFATALLLLLSMLPSPATDVPDIHLVSVVCNANSYTAGDPFEVSRAFVFSSLLAGAPVRNGNFYTAFPYPIALAYGYAACYDGLDAGNCAVCLRATMAVVNNICPMAFGAQVVLRDCVLRYEDPIV